MNTHTSTSTPSIDVSKADWGLFALRAMLGLVFVFHGSQKLFGLFGGYGITGTAGWMESLGIPFPVASATLVGLVELFGGLALWSGFGMRLLAAPLSFAMVVGAFTAHSGFDVTAGGMEYPLTLAVAVAALGWIGPGRFALGARKRAHAPAASAGAALGSAS